MGSCGGERTQIRRVCIVGAGPSGVAASKYGFNYLFPLLDIITQRLLSSLIGPPTDISLPKTASILSMYLNSKLPSVASGIIQTTPLVELTFPRPIHISLWMNQSGTLSQNKTSSQRAHNMQHLCHQCMNVWRPIFHTLS